MADSVGTVGWWSVGCTHVQGPHRHPSPTGEERIHCHEYGANEPRVRGIVQCKKKRGKARSWVDNADC